MDIHTETPLHADPEIAHLRDLYEIAMEEEPRWRARPEPEVIEEMRREMTPALKCLVAYHEAGHAVICWKERVPVAEITIEPDGHSLGSCTPNTPDLHCHDRIRRRVRIGLAGRIAEQMAGDEPPEKILDDYGPGDQSSVKRGTVLPECVLRGEEANEAWRRWQWICVRDDLRQHWPLVEALAEALLERGTLCREEVETIIREADRRTVSVIDDS